MLADVQEEPLAIGRITVEFSFFMTLSDLTGRHPSISIYSKDKIHSAPFFADICSSDQVWDYLLVGFDPIRVNGELSLPYNSKHQKEQAANG